MIAQISGELRNQGVSVQASYKAISQTFNFSLHPPRVNGLCWATLLQLSTSRPSHLCTISALGHDSLVWLARLQLSSMDFLIVTVELVLASETLVVVFAADDWAFEAFGIDAVLGRGVAQ